MRAKWSLRRFGRSADHCERLAGMDIQFVASVAPITTDPAAARRFYADALGVSFEGGDGDYVFTDRLAGVKHFGLWPLAEAAKAAFGTDAWPDDVPVPQASIEFEVG